LANSLGAFSFASVLAENFSQAESASREAIVIAPGEIWIETNLAHALMLQGKLGDADAVYSGNRGKMIGDQTWEQVVVDDFAMLREAGIDHPHMAEVEAGFKDRAAKE
jgi:hypothetical protein